MLRTAMRLLAERFGGPPELNLWVRTAPRGAEPFHWHGRHRAAADDPRPLRAGDGIDINVYPPEQAASDLKECLPA